MTEGLEVVPVRCEDCPATLDRGNYRPLDLLRPVPGLFRRDGHPRRRFRIVHLCRRCAAEALRLRASTNPKIGHKGRGGVLRTRDRVAPKRGGRPRLLSNEQVRAAHVIYEQGGLSIRALAEKLLEAGAPGTRGGLESALFYGFKRLGLAKRPPGLAMAMARFGTDGTKTKRQKRRCSARARSTGKRCKCWAQRGSKVCWDHRETEGGTDDEVD
jgi:hypothetical protein